MLQIQQSPEGPLHIFCYAKIQYIFFFVTFTK